MRRRHAGALAALVLLALTANVSASAAPAHGPPTQILGLKVAKEDISKTLAGDKRALYVDSVGLYSFRDPSKLLEATLEIAHFRSSAPSSSADFQATIVNGLGGSAPTVVRVGGEPVYVTTSKGLTIAIWFTRGFMLALSIRDTYTQPKELLRVALAINP